jgi:hypothetical protein
VKVVSYSLFEGVCATKSELVEFINEEQFKGGKVLQKVGG